MAGSNVSLDNIVAMTALFQNLVEMFRLRAAQQGLTSEQIDQIEAASVTDSAKKAAERDEMGKPSGD